jgi:hypothetical protein
MSDQEKQKLSVILSKIKHIGNVNYDGKIFDNILNIFADLSLSEQRALLKNLITICFIVQDQVLDNAANIAVNKSQIQTNKENIKRVETEIEDIKTELLDIESINKVELIKLKTWFVKATFVFLFLGLIVFLLFTAFIDGSEAISSMIKNVFDVVKEIIG